MDTNIWESLSASIATHQRRCPINSECGVLPQISVYASIKIDDFSVPEVKAFKVLSSTFLCSLNVSISASYYLLFKIDPTLVSDLLTWMSWGFLLLFESPSK